MAVFCYPPKRQCNPDDDIFTTSFQTPIHRTSAQYLLRDWVLHPQEFEIRNLKSKPSKTSNLTPDESAALINLQKRDDTVIKPADKEGAVVVLDRKLYIEEARKQLDNPNKYQKLNNNNKKPSFGGPERNLWDCERTYINRRVAYDSQTVDQTPF